MSTPTNDSQFTWYLVGAGAWFLAFGIQMVMFSYLVTTVLQGSEIAIAVAQASLTIVSMALLLFGGTLADRADARQVLIRCQIAALVPATALAAIIWFDALKYEWLIVYGLAMGAITAFTTPAREALMGDVIGNDRTRIQRTVTTTIGVTFLLQMVGMLSARFAADVGPAPIILAQTAAQLVGLYAAYRLSPSTRHSDHGQESGGSAIAHIRDGLREVASSPTLLPINTLTLAIGVLFMGAFMVILPLILRAEFGASVQQISTLQASFWGGTIISSIAISRVGNIVNRGRLIVGAISIGILVLTAMSMQGPLILLYALVFIWGCGAGVMMSMSRTTVQEYAPPAHRARVLSMYQLGFTGGMSIGALLTGLYAAALGPRMATLVPAGIMALVLTYLVTRTKLWSITALKHEADAAA